MSEISKFDAYKKKLQGVCDENDLVFSLKCETFPITLTVQPLTGLDDQPSLFEQDDEPENSPDASIVFFYQDGELIYRLSERFTIGDALFANLKRLFKNLHYTYLQFFHREIVKNKMLVGGVFPDADDYDPNVDTLEPAGDDELEPVADEECDAETDDYPYEEEN